MAAAKSRAQLQHCCHPKHAFGCTFFDTAESYGKELYYPGHNEEIVGEAVEPFRKDIVLAASSHLGNGGAPGEPFYITIRLHLDASLSGCARTMCGPVPYLHRINERFPVEEIAQVLGRLSDQGADSGWGLSRCGAVTVAAAHQVTPLSAVQNLYNILERDCEKEIFPYTLKHHIGVVPFSPIASGFLSGKVTAKTQFQGDDVRKFVPQLSKENLLANQPILDILNQFAKAKDATPAQISLAWMLHKYPNVVPIPGSKNQERILENLGAWNVELTDSEFAQLEGALDQCQVHGHRGIDESEQRSFGKLWAKNFQK